MSINRFDLQLFAEDAATQEAITSAITEAAEALKSEGLSPDPSTGADTPTDGATGEESTDETELVEPDEPSDKVEEVPEDNDTRASKRIRQLIEERNTARAEAQQAQQAQQDPRIQYLAQHPEIAQDPHKVAALFGAAPAQVQQAPQIQQGEQEPDWENAFPDDPYQQGIARVAWHAEQRISKMEKAFADREAKREHDTIMQSHLQAVAQEEMAVMSLPEISKLPQELRPSLMADLRKKASDMMYSMRPPTLLDAYNELYGKHLQEVKTAVAEKRNLPPTISGNRDTDSATYSNPMDCLRAASAELRKKQGG